MRFSKIGGICLIIVGIALLVLQVMWIGYLRLPAQVAPRKVEREFKSSPYAGIFGVALIVGGVGFVFAARRKDEPNSRRVMR